MSRNADPKRYLETQVLTASRERLLLMLYDGALRFCEEGRDAIGKKDLERGHHALIRAQRIVIELWCALNPEVDAGLAKSLGGLYSFAYLKLVHANVEQDVRALDAAAGILATLRKAWAEAVGKARLDEAPPTASVQLQG